jgi:integrase
MTSMSISVKYRPSTVAGKTGSLYLLLIKNRKTKTVTTPYRVYPEEWNTRLSTACLGSSLSKRELELRETVASLEKDLSDLKDRIRRKETGGGCSLEEAVELYRNQHSVHTFSGFVEELRAELPPSQARLGEAYLSASNNLKAFNGGKDLPLNAINTRLMKDYEAYMTAKGNQLNTVSFYIRNTRAVCNKAVRRGLMERKMEDPFTGVFKGIAKTNKRAVSQEVIDQLKNLNLLDLNEGTKLNEGTGQKNMSLRFARDMFLLSFLLRGISFIDLAFLKKENIRGNVIVYIRRKTGQRLEIAVTPDIRRIIARYARYCRDSEFLLPVLPSGATRKDYLTALRRQNRNLKILSGMIESEKLLTTYVSRHSWATIAREKGIPLPVISLGMGHCSERTTQIYLDSFDYSILHKANSKITDFLKKKSSRKAS